MSNETGTPALGGRFLDALQHAAELHASHPRKGTTVPYVSHLLSVAGLVLEDGGTEDEAIAALLHDALEDCPDQVTARELEVLYGPEVRSLAESRTCREDAQAASAEHRCLPLTSHAPSPAATTPSPPDPPRTRSTPGGRGS
jgi:(p)ppGpp synthase/HD superfamily hydrolase